MNPARTTRATYVAAFLLGVVVALLLLAPAHAAELASPARRGTVPPSFGAIYPAPAD